MTVSAQARLRAREVFETFQALGAKAVETDTLQPAETLLDLYGEAIRARAYVTLDPARGEMMLRPDFTVPVVQMHMREGAEPARYTYLGDVFRKQDTGSARASEFLQVGYEVFDRAGPAAADAEVFVRMRDALGSLNVRAVMGDMGVLTAAVRGLETSPARRGALMRHIWRPARFSTLLERFSRAGTVRDLPQADAPHIGMRSSAEIERRIGVLQADATEPPLNSAQVECLHEILTLSETAPDALATLNAIAARMPAIAEAVSGYEARLQALDASGVDVSRITFEGSYGRTSLEYYDGFVFGFYGADNALPPVASGGRYDALTRVLGQGRSIPAVGGVIRPELLAQLEDLA